MSTETLTRLEKIEEFLSDLSIDIDFLCCIDIEEINSYDDLSNECDNQGLFDVEVIYYRTAMEYLMEHDTSLYESMQLASEMGYEAENINSELLASLLQSQELRQEFYDLESEITDFFDELEEEEEEE